MIDSQMLNLMLQKAINQTLDAGIKCGKIIPAVKVNKRANSFLGKCELFTEYKGEKVFAIQVSYKVLNLKFNDIMEILCHEVLHSCEGCMNHRTQWKRYAKMMNEKYGYNIRRCANGEEYGLTKNEIKKNYCLRCVACGEKYYFARYCKRVRNPHSYGCKCGGNLERIF